MALSRVIVPAKNKTARSVDMRNSSFDRDVRSGRQVIARPAHDRLGLHGAGGLRDHGTVAEQVHRRNAAHARAGRRRSALRRRSASAAGRAAPAARRRVRRPAPSCGTGRTRAPTRPAAPECCCDCRCRSKPGFIHRGRMRRRTARGLAAAATRLRWPGGRPARGSPHRRPGRRYARSSLIAALLRRCQLVQVQLAQHEASRRTARSARRASCAGSISRMPPWPRAPRRPWPTS